MNLKPKRDEKRKNDDLLGARLLALDQAVRDASASWVALVGFMRGDQDAHHTRAALFEAHRLNARRVRYQLRELFSLIGMDADGLALEHLDHEIEANLAATRITAQAIKDAFPTAEEAARALRRIGRDPDDEEAGSDSADA